MKKINWDAIIPTYATVTESFDEGCITFTEGGVTSYFTEYRVEGDYIQSSVCGTSQGCFWTPWQDWQEIASL